MSNFLYVFFISLYSHQLVLGYKFNASKCVGIDISEEYHGESSN